MFFSQGLELLRTLHRRDPHPAMVTSVFTQERPSWGHYRRLHRRHYEHTPWHGLWYSGRSFGGKWSLYGRLPSIGLHVSGHLQAHLNWHLCCGQHDDGKGGGHVRQCGWPPAWIGVAVEWDSHCITSSAIEFFSTYGLFYLNQRITSFSLRGHNCINDSAVEFHCNCGSHHEVGGGNHFGPHRWHCERKFILEITLV